MLAPISNSSWHSVPSSNLPDVYPCSEIGNDSSAFSLSFLELTDLPKYVVLRSEFSLNLKPCGVYYLLTIYPHIHPDILHIISVVYYQNLILPVLFLLWFLIYSCICLLYYVQSMVYYVVPVMLDIIQDIAHNWPLFHLCHQWLYSFSIINNQFLIWIDLSIYVVYSI